MVFFVYHTLIPRVCKGSDWNQLSKRNKQNHRLVRYRMSAIGHERRKKGYRNARTFSRNSASSMAKSSSSLGAFTNWCCIRSDAGIILSDAGNCVMNAGNCSIFPALPCCLSLFGFCCHLPALLLAVICLLRTLLWVL